MKYSNEYIEKLLGKFLEGQTTEAEEQILSDFFSNVQDIPAKWENHRLLFQSFKTDAYDFCEEDIDDMFAIKPARRAVMFRLLPWVSVACVAAAIVLWFCFISSDNGYKSTNKMISENEIVKRDSVIRIPQETPSPQKLTASENSQTESGGIQSNKKNLNLLAKSCVQRTKKQRKDKKTKSVKDESQATNEISTIELIEAINILDDVSSNDISVSVSSHKNGFIINTHSTNGPTNSYLLHKCTDGSSLEMKTRIINL